MHISSLQLLGPLKTLLSGISAVFIAIAMASCVDYNGFDENNIFEGTVLPVNKSAQDIRIKLSNTSESDDDKFAGNFIFEDGDFDSYYYPFVVHGSSEAFVIQVTGLTELLLQFHENIISGWSRFGNIESGYYKEISWELTSQPSQVEGNEIIKGSFSMGGEVIGDASVQADNTGKVKGTLMLKGQKFLISGKLKNEARGLIPNRVTTALLIWAAMVIKFEH